MYEIIVMSMKNIVVAFVTLLYVSTHAADNKVLKYTTEHLRVLEKDTKTSFNQLQKVAYWVGGVPWGLQSIVTAFGIIQEEIEAIPLFKTVALNTTSTDLDEWIKKQTDETVSSLLSEADKNNSLKELIDMQNKKLQNDLQGELTKEEAFGRLVQSAHFKKTRSS
jgi:hypothetical protein